MKKKAEEKNKKIIIISTFYQESLNSRANIAMKYFEDNKNEVKIICSDFSHDKKSKKDYLNKEKLIIIKTKKYKSNISLKRIYSHIKFSFDALKRLKNEKCDLVYLILPPNILGYLVSKYTKKNNIKLITDIIDIWPEAIPFPQKIKFCFDATFNIIWKKFREKTLEKSDFIITESKYFYDKLKLNKYKKSKVIFLKKIINQNLKYKNTNLMLEKKEIKIGYLGNIGKIYDFEGLIKILIELSKTKEVFLDIIGIGEKEEFLLKQLKEKGIKFKFHGVIYDEKEKQNILEKCDFGFNGYKDVTEVALSYKSIDYFSYGIPIINSAKGDTWEMIEEYKVGVNYTAINEKTINAILKYKPVDILKFFEINFSYKSLINDMNEVMKTINR